MSPPHWRKTTLQRLLKVSSGDFLTAEAFLEDGIPVFGGNGFRGYYSEANTEAGTILIGRYGALCGNVHVVQQPVWATEHAFRVRPLMPFCTSYIARYIEILELHNIAARSAQPGLNSRMVRENAIHLPPVDEQHQIADFLDHETGPIDELIAKRQYFLALIDAKKQALAAKAVSGEILAGEATGSEGWFGRLPAHWQVRRAKFLFRERQDRSEAGEEELLTVSHITGVTRRSDKDVNMFLAESTEGYKLVSEGDVVINTMWAWMGAMGVSPVEGLISPSYGVYAPRGDAFEADYLDLLLRSRPFVAEATRRSKGIHSSRLRLYPDAFLDILLPVPSRDAQRRILTALKAATEREEQLATLSRLSLGRLREFRAALITAAVTGQIDVATWGKRGTTDRRFDAIEADMAAAQLERHQVRA